MGSLPDQVYLDEVPKLRNYPNIRTLGYVATHYAQKDLEEVLAEVDVYGRWPKITNTTKMRVDGICMYSVISFTFDPFVSNRTNHSFVTKVFDEIPATFDPSTYNYLQRASQAVRNSTSFKDRFIAHNPGLLSPTVLNSRSVFQESYLNLTDITVVFEETFDKWLDKSVMVPLQEHKIHKSKLGMILHGVPNVSRNVLNFVVDQVEETADWLFLTNVTQANEYYHSFSGMFEDVVKSVDGTRWKKLR